MATDLSPVRLLIDEPAAGAWNMAADELLGRQVEEGGPATLRFYRWQPATLSLGYFQGIAERESHPASAGCAVVRRQSGGGAILHDAELTYSYAAPSRGTTDRAARDLYLAFHETLIEALASFGIAAEICGDARCAAACVAHPSFMCFSRRAREDLLVGEHKIAGSAQRRQRRALIQHGSILLAASPYAPELPGLLELGASQQLSSQSLIEAWLPQLSARLELAFAPSSWSTAEEVQIEQLAAERYASDEWTRRR